MFGHSRIDGRDKVHEEQFKVIIERLTGMIDTYSYTPDQIVNMLEEYLSGFQGVGLNRAWCAQTFYPICSALFSQETLWNETKAAKNPPLNWRQTVRSDLPESGFRYYYSVSKHRFIARGGEVIYLQLCNAFNTKPEEVVSLTEHLSLSDQERSMEWIFERLQEGLSRLNSKSTQGLEALVDFIEKLDTNTYEEIERITNFYKLVGAQERAGGRVTFLPSN